jgi:hypothetical protein
MWLNIKNAALYLDVVCKTIRRRIKSGALKSKEVPEGRGSPTVYVWCEPKKVDTSKVGQMVDTFPESSKKSKKLDTAKSESEMMDILGQNPRKLDSSEKLDILQKVDTPENSSLSPPSTANQPLTLLPAEQEEKEIFLESTEDERKVAFARHKIVKTFHIFREERVASKISKSKANLAWDANNTILVPKELNILGISNVSSKTVMKWDKELRERKTLNYPVALLPKSKKAKDPLPKDVMSQLKFICSDPNHPRKLQIHRDMIELFPKQYNISYRTACRLIKKLQADPMTKIHTPKEYKNKSKIHIKRLNDNIPGQHYVSDGKDCDFFVYSPFPGHDNTSLQKILRPNVVAWVDAATGLFTGYCASWGESSHQICNALFISTMNWGVPERITIDNGSGYQNYMMDPYYYLRKRKKGSDPYKKANRLIDAGEIGIYRKLGIKRISYSLPKNPESKTIEALWNHLFEDMERKQAVFAGKSPDDRPVHIKGKTINQIIKEFGHLIPTWDEFIQMLNYRFNEWNNTPRKVLPDINGKPMSPIEVFKAEADIVIPPKAETEELLNIPIRAKVLRDHIYCKGTQYIHPMMKLYQGQDCLVKYDEFNLDNAEIYTMKGERWAQPAHRKIISSFTNQEQFQKALKQAKHDDKVALATYININKEMPGQIDQKKANKILNTTIEDLEHSASKSRDLIKNNGGSTKITTKRKKTLPDGSGVAPDPDNIDYIMEQTLANDELIFPEKQTTSRTKEINPLDFIGLDD